MTTFDRSDLEKAFRECYDTVHRHFEQLPE